MMKSKVGLDFAEVKRARIAAKEIAIQVQHFVNGYSTVAVERTLCRLLGIDGVRPEELGEYFAELKEEGGRK